MSRIHEPSKPYNEVESEFIKERIRERHFELDDHREYINKMIFLEKVILDEIKLKFGSGMKYKSIKNEHEEEYLKILQELDKEKYREEKQKRENEKPSYVKEKTESQKIDNLRNDWNES